MFRLPTYQELSKEQDAINNLPITGRHLVIGPPGTGKTVLAIYRAEMLKRSSLNTQFVVYNRMLEQYLDLATQEVNIGSQTRTFHSWFCSWYKRALNVYPPPQIARFQFDWDAIWLALAKAKDEVWTHKIDHLIIDEAQDLPKSAFTVLRQLALNLTVFADENQRITETNSTIQELTAVLGLDRVHELRKNYRNSRPIAEFAACFYAGLRTGVAELPDRRGVKPRVLMTGGNLEGEASAVVQYAASHTGQDIGVLLPKSQHQMDMISAIQRRLRERKLDLPVQIYISDCPAYQQVDFRIPGIKILNYKSAKGLEFDAVFMPRVDEYYEDPLSDGTKMLFYMLTSRAREWLCITHTGNDIPRVMAHVPADLYDRVLPRQGTAVADVVGG